MFLKKKRRRKWWKILFHRLSFFIVAAIGLASFFIFNVTQHQISNDDMFTHPYFKYNFSLEPVQHPAQTCIIPRLHPFHPSIWNYITFPKPIVCKARMSILTYVDQFGYLRVNQTALHLSGYVLTSDSFVQKLNCYWRPVLRGGPGGVDDNSVAYGKEHSLNLEGAQLHDDAITVACRNFAGITIYENIHSNIRNISWSDIPGVQNMKKLYPNILIFGIDSLSRQAFIRLLPKTYRYLTESLSMTPFSGMNKVGDNTFPNLMALLTGKEVYGSNDLPKDYEYYDKWPLIWKNYSSLGYATLWAEDFPDFGLFNYLAKGFKTIPVDHYLRPLWLAVKESRTLRISSHMCFNALPRHQLQINYLKQFIQRYGNDDTSRKPYFAFSFLAELSHEYQIRVAAADSDFEAFFRWLKENGFLEKTLLIVMSDHGHRFDPIRSTQIGRLEERLPFFAMRLPSILQSSNSKILKHIEVNRGRLTTLYDIHATLVDILLHLQHNKPLGSYVDSSGSGRTLFGIIQLNRTCPDAGIPEHYCTCEPEIPISISDIKVRAAVRAVLNRINKLLRTIRDFCVELVPGSVINAHVVRSSSDVEPQERTRIRLSVEALPSGGIFEATVEVKVAVSTSLTKSTNFIKSSLPYEARVLGDISRINKYGNQSSCIKHDILRKYCFCSQKTLKPNFNVGKNVRF